MLAGASGRSVKPDPECHARIAALEARARTVGSSEKYSSRYGSGPRSDYCLNKAVACKLCPADIA